MAEIKGTNVAAPVVPFTTEDIYATHEAQYGKGGYRSVQTYEDLANIPQARLEEGMVAYVLHDTNGVGTYQFLNGKWVRSRFGGGIPIVNQSMIDDMGLEPTRDEYIHIPSIDKDLYGKVEQNNYKTTINGTYVDVLFRAIRQLQNEVARLKNSFTMGIESYTGTTTAMTVAVDEFAEVPEEEPIWAVDEDGLSDLGVDEMGEGNTLIGTVEVVVDQATTKSYLKVKGDAYWDSIEGVRTASDSKLYMYLTMLQRNSTLTLGIYDPSIEDFRNESVIKVDLSKIFLPKVPESGIYNILFVISRSQKLSEGDKDFYGENFLWVSFSDPSTGMTMGEGYLSLEDLSRLHDEPQYLPKDKRYNFKRVDWIGDTTITKFSFYSKYQDLSHNIIGTRPTDEDYKYRVAHLTIRSVKDQNELVSVHPQLLDNELIWNEDTNKLWIKSKNKLVAIGSAGGSGGDIPGGGGEDSGMTKEELIQALSEMGIIKEANGDLSLNNVALGDITFIHTGSGARFKYSIDTEGNLVSTPLPDEKRTFDYRIKNDQNIAIGDGVRGFIGQLRASEAKMNKGGDVGIYSDRLKIGSLYNPLKTDKIHGCTHSFIELENTSNEDIALEGCYLHYTWPGENKQEISHLALTGIIPAGGTYLIRGARFAEDEDINAFIKVKSFDQEWYHAGKLLTFEIDNTKSYSQEQGYGFCLTYGNTFNDTELTPKTSLVRTTKPGDIDSTYGGITVTEKNKATYPYFLNKLFIDGIYVYKAVSSSDGSGYWATFVLGIKENTLYRNMFELDPAKQAFQAFNTKDSSRARWAKDTDCMILDMSKEFISFPHTDEVYPIVNYTPKASYEKKNVCTGKTDIDKNKPSMVGCFFGTDMYRTRCFNWISYGYFDEYVWFKKKTAGSWSKAQMSYIPVHKVSVTALEEQRDSEQLLTGYLMKLKIEDVGFLPGTDLSHFTKLTGLDGTLLISGLSLAYSGSTVIYTATISTGDQSKVSVGKQYVLHDKTDSTKSSDSPRKYYSPELTNAAYARLTGRFPGSGSFFTSHKVILEIEKSPVATPTEYVYVVGRADKFGNPDPEHTSEEMSFTLYPTSYKTRMYQLTDQQGFHWVEYQVWAAAAEKINEKIKEDQRKENIIPIIINTGDATQNGTRINEWLDYYNGGYVLFNHLEQSNVVGNNDLCNTDTTILGTGDDVGKSNSYYFHLFNCYEIDESVFVPILKNLLEPDTAPKYVPSLYFFDSQTDRFLFINSEITEVNCKSWFGLVHEGKTVNAYTGYQIDEAANGAYVPSFTTIYTMIWRIFNNAKQKNKPVIPSMHEIPFTVITNESLLNTAKKVSRSLSNAGALVGSHLNMISKNEVPAETKTPKGTYWFSRLMEHFGVKLCLGGHKHTYTCSYPLRENYLYGPEGKTNSLSGPMSMPETLESDTANFISGSVDLSKFPYTKRAELPPRSDEGFFPYTAAPNLKGGVVYFMCQATGYKLTSNKELPSHNQSYTWILPKTTTKYTESTNTYKDKPSAEQKYPMFSIVDVNNGNYSLKLARITNIMVGGVFNQYVFSESPMGLQWLIKNPANNFGKWVDEEDTLTTLADSDWT